MNEPNSILEDIRMIRSLNPARAQQMDEFAVEFLADHFRTNQNTVRTQILPMWARAPIA
jgi:hypothetical protein